MDVNQVRFGNYSIGNSRTNARKNEEKAEEKKPAETANVGVKGFNADEMFEAMNIAGLQNKAQISMISQKEINPKDFLSDERISDIEAMMAGFESGVNKVADIIEKEFPGLFAPEQKNALAANIFSQE